jgi:hypothetical protein
MGDGVGRRETEDDRCRGEAFQCLLRASGMVLSSKLSQYYC